MRMRHAAVVAGLAFGLMSGAAKAALIIDVNQIGADVFVVGRGSLDISALTVIGNYDSITPGIDASPGSIAGGTVGATLTAYGYANGPYEIGTGQFITAATSSSGTPFNFNAYFGGVFVDQNYVPTSPILFTDSFLGSSISSLGLTPGTYQYFFPASGETTDGFTVNIAGVSAVPLPASAPVFGAALLALGVVGYGLKLKKAAAAA